MVTFLKLLRRKLLAQNQITRYFIYATGEILLVIFGILIAIQVNNWNDKKKTEKKIHELFSLVLKEAQENLENCDLLLVNLYWLDKYTAPIFSENYTAEIKSSGPSQLINYAYSPPLALSPSQYLNLREFHRLSNYSEFIPAKYQNIYKNLQNLYQNRWNDVNRTLEDLNKAKNETASVFKNIPDFNLNFHDIPDSNYLKNFLVNQKFKNHAFDIEYRRSHRILALARFTYSLNKIMKSFEGLGFPVDNLKTPIDFTYNGRYSNLYEYDLRNNSFGILLKIEKGNIPTQELNGVDLWLYKINDSIFINENGHFLSVTKSKDTIYIEGKYHKSFKLKL